MVVLFRFQSLKALSGFKIPKRKMDNQQDGTTLFDTTTPGASSNNDPVPELLKRASVYLTKVYPPVAARG
jgi:hypothetical protein